MFSQQVLQHNLTTLIANLRQKRQVFSTATQCIAANYSQFEVSRTIEAEFHTTKSPNIRILLFQLSSQLIIQASSKKQKQFLKFIAPKLPRFIQTLRTIRQEFAVAEVVATAIQKWQQIQLLSPGFLSRIKETADWAVLGFNKVQKDKQKQYELIILNDPLSKRIYENSLKINQANIDLQKLTKTISQANLKSKKYRKDDALKLLQNTINLSEKIQSIIQELHSQFYALGREYQDTKTSLNY